MPVTRRPPAAGKDFGNGDSSNTTQQPKGLQSASEVLYKPHEQESTPPQQKGSHPWGERRQILSSILKGVRAGSKEHPPNLQQQGGERGKAGLAANVIACTGIRV